MKEIVRKAIELTQEGLMWKPLYPNNMPGNGLDGYYCLVLNTDSKGKIFGRKYTICFQYKEAEVGTGCMNKDEIDRYILFEKSYVEIKGKTEHPEPSNVFDFPNKDNDTLTACEVNDYGSFIYAYETLEAAKQRALRQYNLIYGYAMSHIL